MFNLPMVVEVSLNLASIAKPALHAAKYPHSAINGLFLCDRNDSTSINVVDCIPLFHSALSLVPMLEIAFYQIESYCIRQGLRICGYYQANENINDNT
ncbi:unnamed protein product [Protopolystoma xenopodis]|uniref:MPN domain-containing protein n=1 Tax=Protopolystoma xenopodis TaxID=117903 RepID=A0A448WMX8_9PLAT|nr:unnamed protein product [Protopolystoma xenopodis]